MIISEKKLEEKKLKNERRKNRKNFSLKPKNQIGYITNFFAHPWGGLNYFNHFSNRFGIYIDYRPSANAIHPANFTNYYEGDENITKYGETLWTSVFNVGISFRLFNEINSALMFYGGIGTSNKKTYMAEYDEFNILTGDWWYYEDGGKITSSNINFGILRQTKSTISWQVGFDSAVRGIKFWNWHYLGLNHKKMKKKILIIFLIFSCFSSKAQDCISGNCHDGFGKIIYSNGQEYIGEFKNGEPNGYGESVYINGDIYLGEYNNGLKHGYGVFKWINGHYYFGKFKNGQKDGFGVKLEKKSALKFLNFDI